MSNQRLSIGYVAGAHGVHGDVRIQLLDPASKALSAGCTVWLVRRETQEELGEYELAKYEPVPGKTGKARGTLSGVTGRDAAEGLRGCTIMMARADLPALSDDEFYLSDVVGKRVTVVGAQGEGERNVGTVIGIMNAGAQDLFEVEFDNAKGRPEQWLLPIQPDFIRDVDDERVLADLPAGMLPEELESP